MKNFLTNIGVFILFNAMFAGLYFAVTPFLYIFYVAVSALITLLGG